MTKYETFLVVDSEYDEEARAAVIQKFKDLIESEGQVESVDEWGIRKFAYPINYKKDGYYVLINFTAEPAFPKELERVYKITDGIIKSIIVKRYK